MRLAGVILSGIEILSTHSLSEQNIPHFSAIKLCLAVYYRPAAAGHRFKNLWPPFHFSKNFFCIGQVKMHRFLPIDGAGSNNFENLPLGPQSSRALPQFLGTFPGSGGDCSEVKLAGAVHHLYPAANESRAFTFVTL